MVDRIRPRVKLWARRIDRTVLTAARAVGYRGAVRIIIACGQFAARPGDLTANTSIMRGQAAEAAGRGAGLIVFPELALCGYLPASDLRPLAVRPAGPEIAALARMARELSIALAFGFAERAGDGSLHDSMAFVDAAGSLRSIYRKVHLFGSEGEWATAGGGFESFDFDGLRIGMWICYDTRFPEAARSLALSGARLCLAASAWFGPAEEWELALRARALDNGIFTAGAALQGAAIGQPLRGASAIVDPHGRLLARGREGVEEVIAAPCDEDAVEAFRARLPLLRDRRPDAYG
jgi:predicted amidohydrolase